MALPILPLAVLFGAVGFLVSQSSSSSPKSSNGIADLPPPEDEVEYDDSAFFDEDAEPEPEPEPVPDVPGLVEDEDAFHWSEVIPCASDLEGYIIPMDEFVAQGKRSAVLLITCKRETELEGEFHAACADYKDAVDFIVIHTDDIDFTDPDNAPLKELVEAGCEGLDGALAVVHYDPSGPRLLMYDGFEGPAREALSYPNAIDFDPYDVVDLAFTLAVEGSVPGLDGEVVDGEDFEFISNPDNY